MELHKKNDFWEYLSKIEQFFIKNIVYGVNIVNYFMLKESRRKYLMY